MLIYRRQRRRVRFAMCKFLKSSRSITQDRAQFSETSNSAIFHPGDGVEALAFDPIHHRVVATSHNGSIKMFRLENEGRDPT